MKIGILTYHHTTNFGSLLQTYALARTTVNLGLEYEIIDYRNVEVEAREASRRLGQCKGVRQIRDYFRYEPFKKKREAEFAEFSRKNLNISLKKYDIASIKEANGCYDAFMVGSDLVWDFSINGHDLTYMLDFVDEGVKRIAYASSAGQAWTSEQKAEIKILLDKFKYIGVREYEIQQELSDLLDINVDFVGDPTLLVKPEIWKGMAAERIIAEDYILVYFSDKEQKIYEDALRYGKEKNLPVYLISCSWVPETMKAIRPTKIEEFLSLILYADTVFSASYHGMLFSLYFEKNFYFYNRGWQARMRSIAGYLGIEDRERLSANGSFINYDEVGEKMEELRNISLKSVEKYLKD